MRPNRMSSTRPPGLQTCVHAALLAVGLVIAASAGTAAAPPTKTEVKDRGPEIDEAIERLRNRGTFVRDFHARGDARCWVQIISTGSGPGSRRASLDFDDDTMTDVEVIARGVTL